MPTTPFPGMNDTLYASQWYLKNTGQRYNPGDDVPAVLLDLNIESVWNQGITGAGVIIGVADDGIDLNHPDLQASLLKNLTYNSVNDVTGVNAYNASGIFVPTANAHSHGTVVGSIATATGNNSEGIVGVAFGAKLVSALVIHTPTPAVNFSSVGMFTHLKNSGVGVSINSYGQDPAFSENYYIAPGTPDASLSDEQKIYREMQDAATNGRGGLGMVIEVSAGNEATNKADSGMTGFTSNRFTIVAGAMNELGKATDYTSPGASVLVSAFGGVATEGAGAGTNTGFGVISADVSGAAGDNKAPGAAGNYAFQNQGTSYSGPMVGATAALMLQANPNLGFRDVANILAMTARGVGDNGYTTNAATDWNLGGMHFSRSVGFGLIDVAAAVQLAQSWTLPAATAANWLSAAGVATIPGGPLNIAQTAGGTTVQVNVANNLRIERMEFDLKITSTLPSQLRAEITSPQGTTIVLFNQPLTKPQKDENTNTFIGDEVAWPDTFQIGSTAFLGERSQGTWTLKLYDVVNDTEIATVDALTVRAWGSSITNDNQYIFTEEYASAGRSIANDALGNDTINAAATHSRAVIDLTGATASSVGAASTKFNITNSTIENAIGGAGDDSLKGNALANRLTGALGDDLLIGGNGNDTLDGGAGSDTASYAEKTASVNVLLNGASLASVLVGGVVEDSIRNIEHLIGGTQSDVLQGDALGNNLAGLNGNDDLRGNAGKDTLDGGAGIDRAWYTEKTVSVSVLLNGANAASVFVGGVLEDSLRNIENVIGGTKNDVLQGDALANNLSGWQGNDDLRGNAGNDTLDGGEGIDRAWYTEKTASVSVVLNGANAVTVFVGGVAEDSLRNIESLIGGTAGDTLVGDALANNLAGWSGNDTLSGALGNDTLAGGEGSDRFLFNSTPGASNIDTITDFQLTLDKIVLDDDIFTALGIVGTVAGVALTAAMFQLGTAANDAGDRIVYNQATGQLFYDTDGSGAAAAQQQIALIGVSTHAALTAGDFLVVA